MTVSEKQIENAIKESIRELMKEKPYLHYIDEGALNEMGMKPGKYSDKFSEVVEELSDDLISICIYPYSQAINHWKKCAIGLCSRFVAQDIDPQKKNTYEIRKKCLMNGLYEKLNRDFSALKKRIAGVVDYYRHKENPNDEMEPNMDVPEAMKKYGGVISSTLILLVDEIAKENYAGVREVISNFNPEKEN